MSSYDSGELSLEQRQQLELERQLQERLRKIREATGRYVQLIAKCESFRFAVSGAMAKEMESFGSNRSHEMFFACDSFTSLKHSIDAEIAALISKKLPTESEDIMDFCDVLRSSAEKLENTYNKGLSEFLERLSTYENGQAELAGINELSSALANTKKAKKLDYSGVRFNLFVSEENDKSTEEAVAHDDIIDECTMLAGSRGINQDDRNLLFGIISELRRMDAGDIAAGVTIEKFKAYKGNIKKKIRVFNEQYSNYLSLATEWRKMFKDIEAPPDPVAPGNRIESILHLENEINALKRKINAELERRYIVEQIEIVMGKYGYKDAKPIILRGVAKGQSYLLDSETGTVHVFISDKNHIMLEPIGLKELDSGENVGYDAIVDTNISNEDRDAIFDAQIEFCKINKGIIAELKKRGVIISNVSTKEASRERTKLLKVRGRHAKSVATSKTKRRRAGGELKKTAIKLD
jgi:hypothetical protein